MIARSEDLSPESFDFLSIEQTTVGAALTQLNTNVDNTANVAVKYDAAGGGKITLGATGGAGALAGGVTITNLKAGTIAPGSTDAVNGSQLYAVQQTAGEGWNVTTAATGSGVANGTSVANVAPGATATFTAGNNIIETQSGTTVAIGLNPVVTGLTSVALASGPALSSTGINMGNTKVTNLAAGTLSAASTDAVNGSQLYATNQNVAANTTAINTATTDLGNLGSSTAAALGGGAAYNSGTGTISAPSYDVYGSTDSNVGQAISDLQTKAPVQYSDASGNPTPQVPSNDVTLVGAAAGPVALHNVAAGALNATSTDAVNGSQLYATNQNVAANTTAIATNTGNITALQQNALQWNPTLNGGAGAYDASYGGSAQTITNVANGAVSATSTDAVNGSQLYAVQQTAGEGWNVTTAATGSGVANGTSVANVAPGATATFTAGNNIIETQSGTTVAIGLNPVVTGLTSVALASGPALSSTGIDMGGTKISNLAAGTNPGDAVNYGQLQSVASSIGNAVQYDNVGDTSVTLGGVGATSPVTLTNVAAGTLSATSTDAVNGSQLYATNQNVAANTTAINTATTDLGNLGSSTAAALGGGAAYNSGTGTISAPSYDVYGSTDSNVGQAITDLQTKAPVQYSDASGNPTPLVPSNDVTLVGAAAGPVALHNVAAGAVGSTSTDAVNGSQLYATNQSVAANTSAIATNSGDISALQTDALQWNSTLGTYDASHGSGNPQRIGNVADATQAHDAVNLEQLQSTVGTATADAVMYDNATHGSVTLGGTGATSPVALTNIQAGALNATSTDAVNGSQLYATNQNVAANTSAIATNTGNITALQQNALQWNPALNGGMGAYDASYGGSAQVITNVASGALNATSTDAVNGSQLYATNQNVAANTTAIATTTTNLDNLGNSTASALGGGAAYNSGTGTISAPSYDVYGNSDSNVGQAISDLQTKAPVQYSDASGNPTPQVPSNDVTLVGAAAGPVALHNVAAGAVGSTSTDAVNGSQLYAVQQTAGAGWNLSANGGTAVNVAPGATLDISAGPSGNAIVTQNGTSLTFDVSDNPNFTTVTASGGITAGGAINANGGLAIAAGQTINMGGNTVGNVAAGSLSATSTDAVNGSQLYATNQNVAANAANLQTLGTGMAAGLGGASSYDPLTGTLTTSIEYDGNSYGSVQSVFDQINGAVNGGAGIKYFHVNSTGADSQALGSDSVAIGADAVATNVGDVAIGSGSVTGAATATSGVTLWGSAYNFAGAAPTSVFSVGSAGNERQVTNVAAGQLNATSTDAVNGSQLYATNQAVNSLGTQVNTNTSNISNLQGQINTINQNGAGMFQVSRDLNNQPMPTPTGTNSAAGGAGASASGTNSLAMGNDSNAGGDQSTAVGTSAAASGTGSTAIGQGAEASGNNSVAIGAGSVATGDNTVSVGSAGNLRQITNVAAGTAPTDAATVGQLRAAQSGGVQYDSNTDGSTDYTNVTMDQGGAPATIHNVATGTAANDAVNVGQLNAGISTAENWAQTYTDQRFNQVQSDLSKLGNRANAGIASAIAAANLPQPYAPNQSALSVGLGTFRGETGMAVGLSKITESGRYILKANASSDTRGDLGAGVGAAVVW